jgi:hypothetical protein
MDSLNCACIGSRAKECGKLLQGSWIHPALNLLALACHLDEAGTIELLDVMGKGGRRNIKAFTKPTDAQTRRILGTAGGTGGAARSEAAEQRETMLVPQCLKLFGKLFVNDLTVRHISNCKSEATPMSRVSLLLQSATLLMTACGSPTAGQVEQGDPRQRSPK